MYLRTAILNYCELLLESTGYSVRIYQRVDLLYFGYCLYLDMCDLSESGFLVLWTLFISGYSVWIYQRVDLLQFGYCPHLGIDSIVVKPLSISVYKHFVLLDIERIT